MATTSDVIVFVKFAYQEPDGKYVYWLYFSGTPDEVWGRQWDVLNPSTNIDSTPDETTYNHIYVIKSDYRLRTLEETTCYSMEYAIYGILALSWIDLEGLDDYPENGRMVLHFGDTFDAVDEILSMFDIEMIEKQK